MRTADRLARAGAVAYVLWGLLHFQAAYGVYVLAGTVAHGIVQGRLLQHAWNLAFCSIAAIVVALALNWRNSTTGGWVNAALVGVVDVGFVVCLLVPGYVPLVPGIAGPVLWLAAWALTSLGRMNHGRP